jgi:peptide/nickel transport system permease protein
MIAYLLLYLYNVRNPGQIARTIQGTHATLGTIRAFDHQQYFDRSYWVQYWHFFLKLLHGNLGFSFQYQRSVDSLLADELPRDLVLGIPSLILSLAIAIPVGIAQALKRNTAVDYIGTGVSFVLYSAPSYAVALLLIQFLSISLHVFPAEAPQGNWTSMLAHPSGLILPIASLTLVTYAAFSRYMRSSALDTLAQDYMRTARAKGLPERLVIARHLVRNSLISVVTLVGLSIPVILTGGLIIEQVFNYPGVGLEYFQAAQNNDFQVMLGITVLVGLVTVFGNLVADIGYAALDPRIRY